MKPTIIYLRTSTTEQTPALQLDSCMEIIEKLKITDYEVLEEQKSAFKDDVKRDIFNSIKKEIEHNHLSTLIVWDLDRIYRNRKKLASFFELCNIHHCKVYSFRQTFLDDINNTPEPWNEILFNLMLQIMGWLSEEESRKKSERILNAVRKKEGITKSYRGNKWGRKSVINNRLKESILKLNEQGLTLKQIAEQTYYYDKSNNKVHPSVNVVWKVLKEK